jgi:hypothetical protein
VRLTFGRTLSLLAATSLGAALLTVAAPVANAFPTAWCDAAPADAPCVVSITRDGVPITSASSDYDVSVSGFTDAGGTWMLNWWLFSAAFGSAGQLPAGDMGATFTVTLDVRAHIPRFAFNHSTKGPIVRGVDAVTGDHLITLTGSPVTLTQGCTGSGVCTAVAATEFAAYLDGWVYEPNWYAAQGVPVTAWNNANMWTNVDWTEFPPQVTTNALTITVANSHYRLDGATPVKGFLDEDLPYALVKSVLHIDDPYSLVGGGVLGALSGTGTGTVSVTADDAAGAIRVHATNLSFSKRAVVIKRGVIVPRSGVVKTAKRAAKRTTVRVAVAAGVSRGSKVTGYQARCYKAVGSAKYYLRYGYTKVGHGLVVLVAKVSTASARYCQVRVSSRAGYGPWGRAIRVR